jgi:hypothetical protein
MKKYAILTVMPLLALLVLTGCFGGAKGPSDEEQAMQQAKSLAADLLAAKADNLLNYVSEDFTNDRVSSKQELAEHIQKAKDKGKVEEAAQMIKDHEAKIDFSQAKVTVDKKKGTISVYPIDASADVGNVTVELVFKKDADKVWRVIGINIEGI